MLSFKSGASRFDFRAAGIFVRDGEVLLHRLENDAVWALPGGRVEMGEEAANAVVREMAEETGEVAQCERLAFVVENFYLARGTMHHEIGLYFLSRLQPSSPLQAARTPVCGTEGAQKLEFRWFRMSELSTTNLHPQVLKGALLNIPAFTGHLVQK